MLGLQLDPVDTLFFRDGTPFTADSSPQEDVGGVFPPHPTTVLGALRAALARCNGWDGHGRWPVGLNPTLGDGPNDLGTISMTGPFLLRDQQPLFRAPRHLLGETDADGWHPRLLLRPGAAVDCDLGSAACLPQAPGTSCDIQNCKTGDDWWLTTNGLASVLNGDIAKRTEVVSRHELWREEPRIGLERNAETRTAETGQLYSTRHVRLAPNVSLGVSIRGVPPDWAWPTDELLPLGGENRAAACREWDAESLQALKPAEAVADGRLTLVALTPLDLDPASYCGERPLDAPGDIRVVSACLARPLRIGGWDSLTRRPLPVRSVLAPGSVLFCEASEPRSYVDATSVHELLQLGSRQASGFGVVALGRWPSS